MKIMLLAHQEVYWAVSSHHAAVTQKDLFIELGVSLSSSHLHFLELQYWRVSTCKYIVRLWDLSNRIVHLTSYHGHCSTALTLKDTNASLALKIAAVWTTVLQLVVIVVGTFIIKRYSTSFSVGFLLGMVIVISQQHLLVGITFAHTSYGNWFENAIFSNMSFALFAFYFLFGIILMQFKTSIMIAAVDAKGFKRPTLNRGGD